jgi:hypothetical protein
MGGVGSINRHAAEGMLLRVANEAEKSRATSLDMLKNGAVTAEQIANKIGRLDHARLLYHAGICSFWGSALTLLGFGQGRTEDTYVKIFCELGIMKRDDIHFLYATSLTFSKMNGGEFVFKDQDNHEVKVPKLSDLSKCRHLTTLAINANSSISELNLSGLNALRNINVAGCENLKSLILSEYYDFANSTLEYVNVSGTAIESLDISRYGNLRNVRATSCPKLRTITCGPKNAALHSLQACDNLELVDVGLQNCPECTTINLRGCPKLAVLRLPEQFNGIATINLLDCGRPLSSDVQKSLDAISGGKYVHVDK